MAPATTIVLHLTLFCIPSCRYRCLLLSLCFLWLIIFGSGIAIGIAVGVLPGTGDSTMSKSNHFAPNETRIISYYPVFCGSMSIGTDITYGTTGKFYILSRTPDLSDYDSFSFSKSSDFTTNDHRKWNFYLYPGSTLNVSVCKHNSLSNFSYYLIKGEDNVNRWLADPTLSIAKQNFTISAVCSSGSDPKRNEFPIYNVKAKRDYYMVFYLHPTPKVKNNALEIDFYVSRTKYTVDTDTILTYCSLSYENHHCVAEIPLSDNIGLLALNTTKADDPNRKIDWTSIIYVDASCNTRDWVYLLISLACVVSVVLIVCLLGCTGFGIYSCFRRKNKYSPLSGENLPTPVVEQSPTPSTTTDVTGKQAPIPDNPSYGTTTQPP